MNTLKSKDSVDDIPVLSDDVPVTMPQLPQSVSITSLQQFKAISDRTRSRILGIIQNQPATAKQIADRLGASPGAIGHHLHVLEAAGLAKVVARRLVRGIVANYYTRTAKIFKYELSKEIRGDEAASLEIMSKAYDEMAEAAYTPDEDPYRFDSFPHIRLSPERARSYHERFNALLDEILNETPDPDGKVYGIFVAMFMSPTYMQGPSTTLPGDAV